MQFNFVHNKYSWHWKEELIQMNMHVLRIRTAKIRRKRQTTRSNMHSVIATAQTL